MALCGPVLAVPLRHSALVAPQGCFANVMVSLCHSHLPLASDSEVYIFAAKSQLASTWRSVAWPHGPVMALHSRASFQVYVAPRLDRLGLLRSLDALRNRW
jgi:hypothetical protein